MSSKSPYVTSLIHIVNVEMPELDYNIGNASTIFTQQSCLKQMHNILMYMLHHQIIDAGASPDPVPTPAQQRAALMQRAVPELRSQAQLPRFPTTGNQQPSPEPGPSAVTEVVITQNGTKVIPPGGNGPTMNLPPGANVDATFGQVNQRRTNVPLPPPPYVNESGLVEVVVNPEISPETAAALAAAGVAT